MHKEKKEGFSKGAVEGIKEWKKFPDRQKNNPINNK